MKQINHEIELYYSDLLATKSSGFLSMNFRESFFAFIENPDIPKLSFNEGSTCTQSDLTLDEIKSFSILSEQQIPWGGWLFQRIL